MTRLNLQSIPLASTPSLFFWSQAYSAGTVHLALSLEKPLEEEGTEDTLKSLGKEIIDSFEAEYFTLIEKTLEGIEQALQKALENIPSNITVSLAAAAIVEDILYVLSLGGGKIQIQREGKFGTLLATDFGDKNISKGSGKVFPNDRIMLGTKQFYSLASEDQLKSAISGSLEEGQEVLTALTAIEQKGAAAVLIFANSLDQEEESQPAEQDIEEKEEIVQDAPVIKEEKLKAAEEEDDAEFIEPLSAKKSEEEIDDDDFDQTSGETPSTMSSQLSAASSLFEKTNLGRFIPSRLPRSKKTILFGIVILALILVFGIVRNIQNKEQQKTEALFASVYPQAQQKYDEGVSLQNLNKNLARDDFQTAQKILNDNKDKFPKDSPQKKKIDDLLAKVNSNLESVSATFKVNPAPVGQNSNLLLDTAIAKKDSSAFAQDDKSIYFANSAGVSSIDKKTKQEKQIIKKDWDSAVSIAPYLGNIYLLDTKDSQIYKFVAGDSGYSKQNYLSSGANISSAVSIAIDGSIWVLQKDGTILKFTKGKADSYSLTGLDKNLSNPTQIWTNVDSDNYYLLDNGNLRIVVVNKEKGYSSQFVNELLNKATLFDVLEKDKKILFISGGKIYYFNLQ